MSVDYVEMSEHTKDPPESASPDGSAASVVPSPFPPTGKDRIWVEPTTKPYATVMISRALLVVCLITVVTISSISDLGLDTKIIILPIAGAVVLLCYCILYGSQGPRWSLRYRIFGCLGPVPRQFYRSTYIEPGYEPVAEAFAATLAEGRETSLQFAVYVKGKLVVDLAGSMVQKTNTSSGSEDNPLQMDFDSDIYSTVWSCSKVVTSILMAWLVDQGHLDYQAKICDYWPEFTGGGKEKLTVAQLLQHNAGLHGAPWFKIRMEDLFPENLSNGKASKVLENMTCQHPPKWVMAYHAMTRGWLLNEIARRVDPKRRTLGVILREEFSQKLGIQDECYLGLPEELCDAKTNPKIRDLDPVPWFFWVICNKICQYLCVPCAVYWKFFLVHTGVVTYATLHWTSVRHFFNPKLLAKHAFAKLPDYKRGESPAANMQASARAMAALANAMATRDPRMFKQDPEDTLYKKISANQDLRYLMPMPPPICSEKTLNPFSRVTFNDGGFCVMACMDPTNVKTHIPSVPGVPYSLGWFGFNGSITAFHPKGDFAICFQPLCFNDLDSSARLEKLSNALMECGRRIHGEDFGRYTDPQ